MKVMATELIASTLLLLEQSTMRNATDEGTEQGSHGELRF